MLLFNNVVLLDQSEQIYACGYYEFMGLFSVNNLGNKN